MKIPLSSRAGSGSSASEPPRRARTFFPPCEGGGRGGGPAPPSTLIQQGKWLVMVLALNEAFLAHPPQPPLHKGGREKAVARRGAIAVRR